MTEELQVVQEQQGPLTANEIKSQVHLIQEVMRSVMKSGEHYGTIPGCGEKPSLFKSGAEKLSMTFRLLPRFDVQTTELPGGHREEKVVCTLVTGNERFAGQGIGTCSTMETKYRYRKADLVCPECGKATIIKGKAEFGGGWLCYEKKGGCGKKWTDDDNPFAGVSMDRVEHDNPADYYNTVLKMAKKRAHVDAIITATAASDIFAQDLEDLPGAANVTPTKEKAPIREPKSTDSKGGGDSGEIIIESAVADVVVGLNNNFDSSQPIKGKNWKERFGIKLADDPEGRTFGTFSSTIGQAAQSYMDAGMKVKCRVKQNGKYWNLEAIEADEDKGKPKASPPNPDDTRELETITMVEKVKVKDGRYRFKITTDAGREVYTDDAAKKEDAEKRICGFGCVLTTHHDSELKVDVLDNIED